MMTRENMMRRKKVPENEIMSLYIYLYIYIYIYEVTQSCDH